MCGMGKFAARSSGGRPPPLHRGDDAVRRAGPVCPAAGRHYRFFAGRWVPPRGAALPVFLRADCFHPVGLALPVFLRVDCFHPVGRGLAPAVVPQHICAALFQSTASAVTTLLHFSLFHLTLTKGRRPPPREGVGTAALRLRRGDCAICGWRFGTIGEFAPCAARVFRPLQRAGISRLARRDRGRCPLDPCNFLKKIE